MRVCSIAASMRRWLGLVAMAALPAAVSAQSGVVSGRVTDQEQKPVAAAQVSVPGTRLGVITGADGRYMLRGVAPGQRELRVEYPGFKTATRTVTVAANASVSADFTLEGTAIEIGGIIVSAARQAQRLTEAPATVSKVSTEVLDNSVGNTWASALKEVKGLDFIQVGMTAVAINARGFNSAFNNRMLMVEDGRIATLPENGLPAGSLTAVPKIDLAGVEVLIGPGAALYGADASNGVVTLQTKSARDFPGTSVEVTGGNRSYLDIQARHAGVRNNWGYKVAGEYQQANDWDNVLTYNITGLPGGTTRPVKETDLGVNSISFDASVMRATAALSRYFRFGDLELSAGRSETDGVGQTNVGRNQLRDWVYDFAQLRFSNDNWYGSLYRTHSSSGQSFAVNRYADAFARNSALSPDSLRMLSDWPSDGQLLAGELQNNFRIPAALNTRVVWGAQYRRDIVSSSRQWLKDRLTGEDLVIGQYGVYGQIETPVTGWLNAVVAARYDKHDDYDAQFSPKAALVFKPSATQTLRLGYNRAFKSPTVLQTSFHIPDWTAVVAIFGNTEGFSIRNSGGTTVRTIGPLEPEENQTWEAGYRGVIAGKLFVDVAGYTAQYNNFMSPLAIIANPFTGATATYAYDAKGNRIVNPSNVAPVTLTYYNLGRARIRGVDAGVNYFVSSNITLKSTVSLTELESQKVAAGFEEATALNSPVTKWTVGGDIRNFGTMGGGGHFQAGALIRHTGSYYFRSGINQGVIPTFTTSDLSLGYVVPRIKSTLSLGISNLYTCSQDDDAPFTYATTDTFKRKPTNKSGKCGFGMKHQEMINMPSIGTMVFAGVRYTL